MKTTAKCRRLALIVFLCVVGATSAADDEAIGRVFMTVAERQLLDRLRQQQDIPTGLQVSAESQVEVTDIEKVRQPAGFIVGPHGKPYQWRDGDFREVDSKLFNPDGLQGLESVSSMRKTVRPTRRGADDTKDEPLGELRPAEPVADTGPKDDAQP